MPDPAEQLARIYQAGFEIEHFERFSHAVGVARDGCIALLEARPDGLAFIGTSGWCMGEVMGVLVERDGRMVFQAKDQIVEATPELQQRLQTFTEDLKLLLNSAL